MKRLTAVLLTTALSWMMMTTSPNIAAATGKGPCSAPRFEVTRDTGPLIRTRKMRHLIRCVFRYVGIPGQIQEAFYVVNRESGYRPWATNPIAWDVCRPYSSNPYGSCGLAQHLARFWPGRVRAYLVAWWFPHSWPQVPVLQARANALVLAFMVRACGCWTPWAATA